VARRTRFAEYKDKYQCFNLELSEDGILLLQAHTNGGSLEWNAVSHDEMADVFADVAGDRDIRAVVHTGTGENYNADWGNLAGKAAEQSGSTRGGKDWAPPIEFMYHLGWYGMQLLTNWLDIDVPVITAVNGPCTMHSEIPLMSDICIAAEDATFCDGPHFRRGMPPNDGQHIVWRALLGPIRAQYFLLTGQTIDAKMALDWGVINEVHPKDMVVDRAYEIAHEIVKRPPMATNLTRRLYVQDMKKACLDHLNHGIMTNLLAGRQYYPNVGGMDPMTKAWDSENPFG
jgi:enoyl-CoA hydratase/carnithine racemase